MDAPSTGQQGTTTISKAAPPVTAMTPASSTSSTPTAEPLLSYRALLLQKTANRIPFTAEGLPTGFYRVDLLPTAPASSEEELQALQTAYIDLSFEYGYPTLPDGRPYWHKLDFEPGFAYGAFQIYLEQLDVGPRELTKLAENTELLVLASRMAGMEDGKLIAKDVLRRQVVEFSILYYWRSRSKAHDLYKDAAYRHVRLRRQMNVESSHYDMATALMKRLQDDVFTSKDFWENMSGKTAVDLLAKLVSIQRVSVGLPAAGPLSQKETPEDMTFEMIMRTIGQRSAQGNVYENNGNQQQGRGILEGVLQDKVSASNMQELIIRVSQSMHKTAVLPNPNGNGEARTFKGRNRTNEKIGSDELSIGLDMSGTPGANLDDNATIIDVNPEVVVEPAMTPPLAQDPVGAPRPEEGMKS